MKFTRTLAFVSLVAIPAFLVPSCGGSDYKPKVATKVVLHVLSDAEMLNPNISSDATAGYICKNIFQALLEIDFKTLELTPVLAEARPTIEKVNDTLINMTFQIRKEAKWDNGTPVTAKDVEFTLKSLMCPGVPNEQLKTYFDFIGDMKLYPEDPRKLTVVCNKPYYLSESAIGGLQILPTYIYDPQNLLGKYSVSQILSNRGEAVREDKAIKDFAALFASEKYQRQPEFVCGSGPYKLKSWKAKEQVVLERKKVYWGDSCATATEYIKAAYPDEIVYRTVTDMSSAITSLKDGALDVMNSIKAKDFIDLKDKSPKSKNFNYHTPDQLAYVAIGMNVKTPELSDKQTRHALSYLVNVNSIIKDIFYGYGTPISSPVHPSRKLDYNDTIPVPTYNPAKAKELLKLAGWKDSNGDGTLDKVINGKLTEFEVNFAYNAGNDMRKAIIDKFSEECRQVGIKINVQAVDWVKYQDEMKNHKYELFISAQVGTPVGGDLSQNFHSRQTTNDGGNYYNFVNNEADHLLDSIRTELDDQKRGGLVKKFTAILYDEMPMIFLYAPTERIAINKRFVKGAEGSMMRPGYNASAFQTADSPAN